MFIGSGNNKVGIQIEGDMEEAEEDEEGNKQGGRKSFGS